MNPSEFAFKLIGWYEANKRDLPWRHTQDPYLIWLSEIILQQTRVNQGMPYYLRFAEAFPAVTDMANAEERDVLRLWQGLGYYSRARNMHYSAKYVANELGGRFPDNYRDILKLKGVGDYTAAAIASFAFNEAVAVLDGNVFRVLARLFGIEEDIVGTKGKKVFSELAASLLPAPQAAVYNQAIMEFGATYCKPVSPDCPNCIFRDDCTAFATKKVNQLPVKVKKLKVKNRQFHYLVMEHDGQLMLRERPGGDIWQGLYDFPLVETGQEVEARADLLAEIYDGIEQNGLLNFSQERVIKLQNITPEVAFKIVEESPAYTHVLTHQKISARFIHLKFLSENLVDQLKNQFKFKFYSADEINALPKPVLINNYLKTRFF